MSTPEKIKLLEQRLETIKACQKLLYEFEQMTVLKIEALEEEMPRSK
jgi:hypothetical protein